jgi:endonuclease/exonuclease/phosphatase (EEP) superfamily protein YafD
MNSSPVRLRVVTMNLANGRARLSSIAALLEELDPDVVAAQELAPSQAEVLARSLVFGKLDPACDHTGMGIALRRPASTWRLAMPYRDAWVAEVLLPGPAGQARRVEIINVHFAAPHMTPFRRTFARRRGQLRALEAHLDGDRRPRAVVGDLNSTPVWPVYWRLRARLFDAAEEAARRRGASTPRTWGPAPTAPRLFRIDHALVERLDVLDAAVHPIAGSDHSALLVDLVPADGRGRANP